MFVRFLLGPISWNGKRFARPRRGPALLVLERAIVGPRVYVQRVVLLLNSDIRKLLRSRILVANFDSFLKSRITTFHILGIEQLPFLEVAKVIRIESLILAENLSRYWIGSGEKGVNKMLLNLKT